MADELPEDFKVTVSHTPYGKSGSITYQIANRSGRTVDQGTVVDGEPRTSMDQQDNIPPQVEQKLRDQIKQVQTEVDKRAKESADARRDAGPVTVEETVSLSHEDLNQGAKEANDAAAEAAKPKPRPGEPLNTAGATTVMVGEPATDTRTRRRTESSGG